MSQATNIEQWLNSHTFYCSTLLARLSPEQCRINRSHRIANNHVDEFHPCRRCGAWNAIARVGEGGRTN